MYFHFHTRVWRCANTLLPYPLCPWGYWRHRQHPWGLHMYFHFHTRGYWRCRQYPGGLFISYYSIFYTRRVLAAPPIPWGPISYVFTIFLIYRGYWRYRQYPGESLIPYHTYSPHTRAPIPNEGIGGTANTLPGLYRITHFIPGGIGCAANTMGALSRISPLIIREGIGGRIPSTYEYNYEEKSLRHPPMDASSLRD